MKKSTVLLAASLLLAALAPRAHAEDAGLWLNRGDEGFAVMDVVAGGPAAEAGLKVGDTIVSIDGRSAKELSLPELRARFKESTPGTKVRLTVKTGRETREATVVMRDLV
jgi:C-terminal processing protease CtpA/Prc